MAKVRRRAAHGSRRCAGLHPRAHSGVPRRAAFLLGILFHSAACGGSDSGAPLGERAGTAASGEGLPLVLTDAAGVDHEFGSLPRRIISLVPSVTETLLALGAGDRLAARTDFDTLSALRSLPSVGEGILPSVERLLVLEPDLVIYFAGPSSAPLRERLTRVGLPHFGMRPQKIDDVRRGVRQLGALAGRTRSADSLLAGIDGTLKELAERVGELPRPRVAYLLGGTPPWVAGPGTFIDELITAAGGANVFGDLEVAYGPVSAEELLARRIDLVFMQEDARDVPPISAIPVARVSSLVRTPGPRVAEAALELGRLLHPGRF